MKADLYPLTTTSPPQTTKPSLPLQTRQSRQSQIRTPSHNTSAPECRPHIDTQPQHFSTGGWVAHTRTRAESGQILGRVRLIQTVAHQTATHSSNHNTQHQVAVRKTDAYSYMTASSQHQHEHHQQTLPLCQAGHHVDMTPQHRSEPCTHISRLGVKPATS